MKHLIAVLIENQSGALSTVAGLFSQRSYNIDSLTVAPTQDATLSRITIATQGDAHILEQIVKQLNKLVVTFKVIELSDQQHIEREVALVKVRAIGEQRTEMHRLVEVFRCHIIDITPKTFVIQVAGKSKKIDAFLAAVGSKYLLELTRSGVLGISRGDKAMAIQ